MMGKTRRKLAPKLQYIGLGALALATASAVAFAFAGPTEAPPVSSTVASAYATGTAAPTLTTPPVLPSVAFLGDSYVEGSNQDAGSQFPDIISARKNWNEIMLGEAGSGYVTAGKRGTTFAQRVQAAIDSKPVMVIVSGGFNDKDVAALPAAVTDVLTRLRDGLPGVPVVVLSNFVPGGTPTAIQSQKHAIIEQAAKDAGVTFIEVSDLFTDTTSYMIGEDKTHPTAMGHQRIAEYVMAHLPEPKA